jgi:uncharacterized protein (DUF1501 family)
MSDCSHCNGLSRSRLLHRAAEAGIGLPSIEPGMPLPAGTGMSRRSFVARSLGVALAVYGGSRLHLDAFEEGIAAAASVQKPILVSVFLEGGADGLSMLSPQGDPFYRKLRPSLALNGGTAFAEDPTLFWHPALDGLSTLYGEQKVTVFPAIGYTNANQSHFTSRHFWEVGATSTDLQTGWLGRYLDAVGADDNPLQGISLDNSLSPALATANKPVATLESPADYDFYSARVWGDVQDRLLESIGRLGAHQSDPALETAARAAREVDRLRNQLKPLQGTGNGPGFTSPVAYPKSDDSFPARLAVTAEMFARGMPMRVVALTAPGQYDTHSDQPTELADGLKLTSDSLLAFQRDLEARNIADRVLVLAWSEFGRRAEENGSSGTDHGAAGAAFLIGTRARGTMVGEYPGLAKLDDDGNVRATSDFRGVYASLLEQWLGTDAGKIIPDAHSFARPVLLKA